MGLGFALMDVNVNVSPFGDQQSVREKTEYITSKGGLLV